MGLVCVVSLAALLPAVVGEPPPNVLLIIADDLGVDRVGAYAEHPDPGHTPVLDQLAADGVLFRHAWTHPMCSATRASMLTGRYAFRTGVGSFIGYQGFGELATDELSLPDVLPAAYRTAAVGKWHLADLGPDQAVHPLQLGFEHHRGSLSNFGDENPDDYFVWTKHIDGVASTSTTYATTDTVDEALALIAGFSAPPEPQPWFLWVAFNAPHKPYHAPPAALHSYDLPPLGSDDPAYMRALTEAMDTEIGRLFASMDPAVLAHTVVIFVGDNGTSPSATTPPFVPSHAKGTTFEGGLNVPLIIAGPGVVVGAECTALVNSTDLFATVAELAGAPSAAADALSLVPYLSDPAAPSLRTWVYAERFAPDHAELASTHFRAVREERFKLRRNAVLGAVVTEHLYDLAADPFESDNLLAFPLAPEAQAAYDRMDAVMTGFTATPGTWTDLGWGLVGSAGVPRLSGAGTLVPGEPMQLVLEHAPPNAPLFFVVGLDALVRPLYGTMLVPDLDLVVVLPTDATGTMSLAETWPLDVPPGLVLDFQAWPVDPAGNQGVTASNALRGITP